MEENEGMILEIMTSFGMAIPLGLTKRGWLREFEKRLTDITGLWYFVKTTKIDDLIKNEDCIELFGEVKTIKTEVQGRVALSNGEMWTLSFLKSINESDFISFIKMIGPLQYMVSLATDIKKNGDSLTKNLKAALFIYLFQNLYELLLSNIDSCFYVYLERTQEAKGEKIGYFRREFIEKRKEARRTRQDIGKHANPTIIQGMLREVYKQECENEHKYFYAAFLDDTIFNQMTARLRNSSAHFNAFYDDQRDKIVFLDGEEMTMGEFICLYEKLFLFLTTWADLYLSGAKDEMAFASKINEEMEKMRYRTEKLLHKIVRDGKQADWNIFIQKMWGNSMVRFEEKKEIEDDTLKTLPPVK
jgi:hypothetical protein